MQNVNEGIILIDKPVGPSSFLLVRRVRGISRIKAIGHAGTLDPMASGLVVICVGRYTKLAGLLTGNDKVYETTIRLGVRTNTDDTEGEILEEKDVAHLQHQEIIDALEKMRGSIMQAPPKFSAIKIDGMRAYARARADEDFELEKRAVTVFDISDVKITLPDVSLRVHCSKGFYIRSLARDLGDALKVGGHATKIHRVKSGTLSVENAIGFDELSRDNFANSLVRGRAALSQLTLIDIDEKAKRDFSFGRNACEGMPMTTDFAVAVCGDDPVVILKRIDGMATIARVL